MLLKRRSLTIMRAVVFALVLREVRGKFSANRLAAFWFIFEPVAHIAVMLFIFVVIRNRALPGVEYAIFLVNGIVPFILFKNISLKGMEAANANRGLFAYRQIKPFDMVVARTIVEFSLMMCVFIVTLFGLSWFFGYSVVINKPIEWVFVLAIGCALSFGLALIFCALITIVPEATMVIRIAYMPLYFISGVIFPLWLVPTQFIDYLLWNPYVHIIELLRENSIEYYPTIPQASYVYPLFCALVALVIGLAMYRARRLDIVAS